MKNRFFLLSVLIVFINFPGFSQLPPSAVSLSPYDGLFGKGYQVTWSKEDGATGYEIQLFKDEILSNGTWYKNQSVSARTVNDGNTTSCSFTGIEADPKYPATIFHAKVYTLQGGSRSSYGMTSNSITIKSSSSSNSSGISSGSSSSSSSSGSGKFGSSSSNSSGSTFGSSSSSSSGLAPKPKLGSSPSSSSKASNKLAGTKWEENVDDLPRTLRFTDSQVFINEGSTNKFIKPVTSTIDWVDPDGTYITWYETSTFLGDSLTRKYRALLASDGLLYYSIADSATARIRVLHRVW